MHPSIALFTLLLVLQACGPTAGTQNGGASSSSSLSPAVIGDARLAALPEGNFEFNQQGNMHGTVYVRGYATVEKVPEPFCEQNCAEYDYAFFHVTENGNADFQQYLNQYSDNRSNEPRVGLGCVDKNTLYYENDSDEFGTKHFTLDADTTAQILAASKERPIAIRLAKKELSGGRGAPACYSHFTEIAIWNVGDETSSLPSSVSGGAQASTSNQFVAAECKTGGCSGELCVDASSEDLVSNCIWKEEFQCYKNARCETQADGHCGWTQTRELNLCISNTQAGPSGLQ